MNCPICQAPLEPIKMSLPFGSISRWDCTVCQRYLTNQDGTTELIKNTADKWWIVINHEANTITVISEGYKEYPYIPVNYTNPQETIARLISLKAFL